MPLYRLFEAPGLSEGSLPPQLSELYDGGLAIPEGGVYANFVSSIDGIVALEGGSAPSGGIISGRNEADRFVMGLLRAFADAVLVGAGTVRAEGGRALWTPEYVFPAAADSFRALRQTLKRDGAPRLVIVSARGDLDPSLRALQAGALVLTTMPGAVRLRGRMPKATDIRVVHTDLIDVNHILDLLAEEGYHRVLTEGGPQLFGQLVANDRVDELFLTVSPVLAGQKGERSFGLVHGVDFGREPKQGRLVSVRRQGSHLFLRYRWEAAA